MAKNFRIIMHRSSDSLHFRLSGDFDGNSACELLRVLKKNGRGGQRFIVHTNGLKDIHSFGCDILMKNLGKLNLKAGRILFTGDRASSVVTADLCQGRPSREERLHVFSS